ncbi:MAG: PKD domain-containing protein [Verrucomicrobiota bacterium]|nr:PKD domain-containing protein [Verrucomicrobiota bacterium]
MVLFNKTFHIVAISLMIMGMFINARSQSSTDLVAKNAYTIEIDNENNLVNSTVGSVGVNGAVWPWYSNGVNSDASNSLTVYLTQIRGGTTHRMRHDENSPGSLGQSSGVTTYSYSYSGIPGNDPSSATGVILKYEATEERTLLIDTSGGEYNDSVVIIFSESHLNGGTAPYRVVTMDSGDETTFKVKFPYWENNQDANLYYICLTSYNDSDLDANVPIKITIDNSTSNNRAPLANAGSIQTVNEGEIVTLDGSSSSDGDSDALTYYWTAPAGITLSSTSTVKPTFIAPEVDESTSYEFKLVVNDGKVNSSEVSVLVTVYDIVSNELPLAQIGVNGEKRERLEVKAGDKVTLDGSLSSDPEGDKLAYSWRVLAPEGSFIRDAITMSSMTGAKPTFEVKPEGYFPLSKNQLIYNVKILLWVRDGDVQREGEFNYDPGNEAFDLPPQWGTPDMSDWEEIEISIVAPVNSNELFINLSYNEGYPPISFNFKSSLGFTYEIEASVDLSKWSKIHTIIGTGQEVKFKDNRKAIFEKQYYRIKASD